jgi:hypothetical protein
MKTIYGSVNDLKEFIRKKENPIYPVLLRSSKTDLPLAAWVYNGRKGGCIYTRRSFKKQIPPSHSYAGNDSAYIALKLSILN